MSEKTNGAGPGKVAAPWSLEASPALVRTMPYRMWAVNAYAAHARVDVLRDVVAAAQRAALAASLAAPRAAGLRLPSLRPVTLSVRRSGVALGPTVILTSEATSVGDEGNHWHSFENRRRQKLAHVAKRWRERQADCIASGRPKSADYAGKRARALARDVLPTLNECGRRQRPMHCHCGGGRHSEHAVRFMCRQYLLCDACSRRRCRILGKRMARGLDAALEQERDAYRRRGCREGERPAIVILTMTVRHSGDVAADRDAIERGWRRFYQRLTERNWMGPYCGAWEATSGRDGLGHVHLHVAIIWPRIPWDEVSALWKAACPESNHISMAWRRKDGKASTGNSAARYIGKYLSKGVDVEKMGPELAADIVAASYNRRSVKSSEEFWVQVPKPRCNTCAAVPWLAESLGPGTDGATYRERIAHHVDGRVPIERTSRLPLTHEERWRSLLEDRYSAPVARWLVAAVGERRAFALAELVPYADAMARDDGGRIPRDVVRAWSDVANADAMASTFEPQPRIRGT